MNMLADYQKWAVASCVGVTAPSVRDFHCIGFMEECSEISEAVLLAPREVSSEIGDALWYLGNLAHSIGVTLPAATQCEHDDNLTIYMHICAGQIAGVIKRAGRGEGVNKVKFNTEVSKWLGIISKILAQHDSSLEYVLQYNVDKIKSRLARKKILGSGDHR